MVTNAGRAKILIAFYLLLLFLGGVFILFSRLGSAGFGTVLIFNAANGLLALSCFRSLRIHGLIKFFLFALYVFTEILLFTKFTVDMDDFFTLACVFSAVIGFLVLTICRITLERTKRYFILNFAILPISVLCATLFTSFNIIGLLGGIIIGAIGIAFIWYAGGAPHYESKQIYYEYETSDGRVLTHISGNQYKDNTGRRYELSSNGTTFYEL